MFQNASFFLHKTTFVKWLLFSFFKRCYKHYRLNRFLYRRFITLWPFHLWSRFATFSSLTSTIAVEFEKLAQFEAWLFQYFHLKIKVNTKNYRNWYAQNWKYIWINSIKKKLGELKNYINIQWFGLILAETLYLRN